MDLEGGGGLKPALGNFRFTKFISSSNQKQGDTQRDNLICLLLEWTRGLSKSTLTIPLVQP